MKTLYVSDLDGTLLHSDERTSEYTNTVINALTEKATDIIHSNDEDGVAKWLKEHFEGTLMH